MATSEPAISTILTDVIVLDAAQIRTVRDACIEEIKRGPQVVNEVASTIDEFARFCVLLAKPENHIKVRSGQYVEKQVPQRLDEVSGDVPRPASPFITHETILTDGDGGCCISWHG
jgi:hypothetical protein